MDSYFNTPMGMGRYPEKSRAEVFAHYRQYFDQVLHKNMLFRQAYADAYQDWLKRHCHEQTSPRDIMVLRINAGIRHMGPENIQELFSKMLAVANEFNPGLPLPADLDYNDTLPGGRLDLDERYHEHMQYFRRFWMRLALPEVREEDQ